MQAESGTGTITHKCPNCGAGLIFDPEKGLFVCEYCYSDFTLEQLDSLKKAEAKTEELTAEEAQDFGFTGETTQNGDVIIYNCPSCGAEIVTDETTAATFCYYCHNPVVLGGKLSGELMPDSVVPFFFNKEKAENTFSEWIGNKKFVPRDFYSRKQIEKLTGIYFPYWLYDCKTDSAMTGEARDLRVWRAGNVEYTETKVYQIQRKGNLEFHNLPKKALKKAESELMQGIFPYDMNKQVKFDTGYLSGFQAERRDLDSATYADEIHKEIEQYATQRMRNTVSGHNSFNITNINNQIIEEKYSYALLPVWILTYRVNGGKMFYFAMNGQTGEVCGKLPVDMKKLVSMGVIIFILVFLIGLIGGWLV